MRFLESKGTKPRFAQEHLCLWANLIADGRAEREKEPNWQFYLDANRIRSLPIPSRDMTLGFLPKRAGTGDGLMAYMLFQQQEDQRRYERRREDEKI